MTGKPFLTTERLELWQPRAGDLMAMHGVVTHPATGRYLGPQSKQFSLVLPEAFQFGLRRAHGSDVFITLLVGGSLKSDQVRVFRAQSVSLLLEIDGAADPESRHECGDDAFGVHKVECLQRQVSSRCSCNYATDGSGANCHMSSVAVCALLTRVGYAPVMQISCRDKNRIAIQGDILGAAAMGVCNILCLTGDGVQAGDHPQALPVFDLDSVTLLETARMMRDEHRFLSGRKLTYSPRVLLGAAENPFALPLEWRAQRLAKKVAAGAQFIQTQYCYDVPLLKVFLRHIEDLGLLEKIFILVGVGPLRSAKTAEWMRTHVPGLHIPNEIVARMAGAADQAREGRNEPGHFTPGIPIQYPAPHPSGRQVDHYSRC